MHILVSDFYKQKFGTKVYKLSIDAGCTCPTRDGTLGTGGCIFCSASGSGDFTPSRQLSIPQQIEEAKKLVDSKFSRKKNVQKKYIAYFQNFTNTYGNHDRLKSLYQEAVNCQDVVGISIATRPDCLDDDILQFIASLTKQTFVQLELGFQTATEETAKYVRRGFTNSVYDEAVRRVHQASPYIHVVTHVIFGLPGDTPELMLNSVKHALTVGTDGLKLTVLYVLQGTDLEKDYVSGKFKVLEMEEYVALVRQALKIIPENIIIHRLTGDPPKKLLVAPQWTTDKKRVLNVMKDLLD